MSSGVTCNFHSGGTTVSSYCEVGCCNDACCGETEISPTTIAIIVCSVVGGLIILLLFALAIFCCIRKRGWCQDKGDAERAKPKKKKPDKKVEPKADWKQVSKKVVKLPGDDKEKLNWVINGKWDWHGWKKQQFGEDSKVTQTDNHKLQPGDYILWSKSRWFPVKRDKNAIKDPRTNIREVGVGTDKLETYQVKKDKKKTATGTGTGTFPAKPIAPTDTRVVTPSQVKPYYPTSKQSGKTSDIDDGYKSKGNSNETPLSTPTRQDTMDSLRDFTTDVLTEANARGEDDFTLMHDTNREERDRLEKLKVSGYVSTWNFPEVKRWNPHSKGTDPKNSKWAKAHDYAKNLNANKQEKL